MLEQQMYRILLGIPLDELDIPPMQLVQGVPGCGKSTYIVTKSNKEDLVLTTTKASAMDLLENATRSTVVT